MDLYTLRAFKDKENYFTTIGLKASENCIKDYESKVLSDEEKDCLKKSALNLHFITSTSRLERWALAPEKRPYEEYYWKLAKIPQM